MIVDSPTPVGRCANPAFNYFEPGHRCGRSHDYYFGNLDERRVTWSMGRDLIMQPPQNDGPVNALTKIYVEIDGKQSTDWTREFTYSGVNE